MTQNGCPVSRAIVAGFVSEIQKLEAIFPRDKIHCSVFNDAYMQNVKKRRVTSLLGNFKLQKHNLTSFTTFTRIPRYASARKTVRTIYACRTISTSVVIAVVDVFGKNNKDLEV